MKGIDLEPTEEGFRPITGETGRKDKKKNPLTVIIASFLMHIDQAIFESEQEIANGAEAVDAEIVFAELEKKHFG